MRQTELQGLATPAYVFDIDRLRATMRRLRAAVGGRAKICYAVKANPFLVEDLTEEADVFEVCSPGEYDICESLRVPAEKIVLSGVYKGEQDVRRAVRRCGERAVYTAESPSQLSLLCRLAQEEGVRLPVLLRLSSGNQFGMDEPTILEFLQRCEGLPLTVVGIQYYSGTQKRAETMRKEWQKLCDLTVRAKKLVPTVDRIEYGPGLRVDYFLGEDTEENSLAVLSEILQDVPPFLHTVLEIGRFIAADCGAYYTRVVDLKHTEGNAFCIVDGGMHHLKYYGQTMAMKVPFTQQYPLREGGERVSRTVCGALCTTADILVRDLPLNGIAAGDILAFGKAGAYSVTEGISLFLSRDLPRIYREEGGKRTLLRDFIQTSKINRKGELNNGKTFGNFK